MLCERECSDDVDIHGVLDVSFGHLQKGFKYPSSSVENGSADGELGGREMLLDSLECRS